MVGVNLVILSDELAHKLLKIIYANMKSYDYKQFTDDDSVKAMIAGAQDADPSTFRALIDLTLEPHRKFTFGASMLLLLKIAEHQRAWRQRCFLADDDELNL